MNQVVIIAVSIFIAVIGAGLKLVQHTQSYALRGMNIIKLTPML